MPSRRDVLIGGAAVALSTSALSVARAAAHSRAKDPASLAPDESYWALTAGAYAVDGRYIILHGGGNNPHPRAVTSALATYDQMASSAPRPHNYTLLGRKEQIRTRLAAHFQCAVDELAITRNTTEGLNIVAWGLDLQAGDEVLISEYDERYAGAVFEQRAARHGIVLKTVPLPVSPSAEDVVARYAAMMTDRTKLLVASHLTDGWGFVLPIRGLSHLANSAGAQLLVDGALSFGHVPIDVKALGCDYYATSLHKHLTAPLGTGALYVRPDRLQALWPLYGVRYDAGDIRKFEAIGTRSGPTIAAIGQALEFYEQVGPANKAARMRYLSSLVQSALEDVAGVRFITERNPALRTGLARVAVDGMTGKALTSTLRDDYRINTYGNFPGPDDGVYISPNLFNSARHMQVFATAIREIAARSG